MSKWELPKVTKEMKKAAELEILMQQESLKESVESRPIDAYLNPRTRRVWNGKEWVDRPVTWNKLLKLPLELKDVMTADYYDLEDRYDINEVNINLDGLWAIVDGYGEYLQVTRCGEPWQRWKKGGLQNETEVITFNTLQDAYNFYLERSDNKDIERKLNK